MRYGLFAALSACLSLIGAAHAQTPPSFAAPGEVAYGPFYFSLGGAAGQFNLSRFNALNDATRSGFPVLVDLRPSVVAAGPVGTFGIVLGEGPFPLLRRIRLETSIGYWTGHGRDQVGATPVMTAFGPGTLVALLSVSGNQGLIFGATPYEFGTATLKTDLNLVTGATRLRGDIQIGPTLVVSPLIGFAGDWMKVDHRLDFRLSQPPNGFVDFDYRLDETIAVRRIGGEVGADAALRLRGGWALTLGANAAFFHQRTTLDARDCFTQTSFGAGASCSVWTTAAGQSESKFAWRLGLALGLSYAWNGLAISAVGTGRYDSAVPGVRNPNGTEAIFLSGAPFPGPARLHYSGQWSYGGMLRATISLF